MIAFWTFSIAAGPCLAGEYLPETVRRLEMLLTETSICGLGYVALNPLVSAAEHWPDEVPMTGTEATGGEE